MFMSISLSSLMLTENIIVRLFYKKITVEKRNSNYSIPHLNLHHDKYRCTYVIPLAPVTHSLNVLL